MKRAESVKLVTKRPHYIYGGKVIEKVAVVIPYYHSQLDNLEQISFQQCIRMLYAYSKILVVPDTMKESEYPQGDTLQFVKVPSEWMESISTYNRMMLNVNFYRMFLDYEYILIYQLDAFVFRSNLQAFCDLGYDYIGAPWPCGIRYIKTIKDCIWYVGNGGLSLRNVAASISMLKSNPADSWRLEEDLYWATCNSEQFRVAPKEIALQFSIEEKVEAMMKQNRGNVPFGCHAWERYDFSFWRSYIEEFGYSFSEEIRGDEDRKKREQQPDKLAVPGKIVREEVMEFTGHEELPVHIWGAGKIGKEMILFLRHSDVTVRCIDRDKALWNKELLDICIESPDSLSGDLQKKFIIVAVKKDKDEIINDLSKQGLRYGRAVIYYEELLKRIFHRWEEKRFL